MSYIWKVKQLVRDGRWNETSAVLKEGMDAIGGEIVELVNRHSGDWPVVIACMRKTADNMESGLSAESRMLLALLNAAYGADTKITHTKVDVEGLKRQMEEGE